MKYISQLALKASRIVLVSSILTVRPFVHLIVCIYKIYLQIIYVNTGFGIK